MATKVQAPQLTPNNRIYLYQLLSRELGCGKQTFMPAVEEALARDRMTADDLGFESTRALLEALEEFVKLTVFKGGRIYATVMAQPAWDEALAALESGKAKDAGGPSNKPWKRKKADKTLKPVRPKRVKRPEPAPEPEPIAKTEAVESPSLPGATAQTRAEETEATSENTNADAVNIPEDAPATETAEALEVVEAAETVETAETVEVVETTGIHEEASLTERNDACACVEGGPQPSPAVSLTVTYDPYSGIDRETKLESHPISPKPDQAPLEPACAPSQLATNQAPLSAAPAPLSPAVLATYPHRLLNRGLPRQRTHRRPMRTAPLRHGRLHAPRRGLRTRPHPRTYLRHAGTRDLPPAHPARRLNRADPRHPQEARGHRPPMGAVLRRIDATSPRRPHRASPINEKAPRTRTDVGCEALLMRGTQCATAL